MGAWVDWLVIAFAVYGAVMGFWRGFVAILFELGAILLATVLTFQLFPRFGGWLDSSLHLPAAYSQPVSLAIVFFALLFILKFLAGIVAKLFGFFLKASPINRFGGLVLGMLDHLVIASIVLALLMTFPTPASVKSAINDSRLGSPLVNFAFMLDRTIGKWGHSNGLTLGFQVSQGDSGSVPLNYTDTNPKEDIESEIKLGILLNGVRQNANKSVLKPNLELQKVAEAHARDMLAKNYFGHISPDGADAAGRVTKTGITATSVGENLAHAPTIELVQAGLVASPEHLKNMLNSDFNSVGIAVFDSGGNGKIVVELFATIP